MDEHGRVPSQFPQTPEEFKGGFLRRTAQDGCILMLLIFIVGMFVIFTLIWLWDKVF